MPGVSRWENVSHRACPAAAGARAKSSLVAAVVDGVPQLWCRECHAVVSADQTTAGGRLAFVFDADGVAPAEVM